MSNPEIGFPPKLHKSCQNARRKVIEYRTFLNTDSPLIVDVWRKQRPLRAVVESLNRTTLESFVFAKPYFDCDGLILAVQDEQCLGFVHAGFGPNSELSDLDFNEGVISALCVIDGEQQSEVSKELLARAMTYLENKNASTARFGGRYPNSPFYLGLYGGSQFGGVLGDDEPTKAALADFGFVEQFEIAIYARTLAGFRMAVDRQQMAIRRQFQINSIADPIETSWWESCTFGLAERDCFHAVHRGTGDTGGSVGYWDIQPLATKWGVSARGAQFLQVTPEHVDTGLRLFLIGESLRQMMLTGIGLVEFQCPSEDHYTIESLQKLGFEPIGVSNVVEMKLG